MGVSVEPRVGASEPGAESLIAGFLCWIRGIMTGVRSEVRTKQRIKTKEEKLP